MGRNSQEIVSSLTKKSFSTGMDKNIAESTLRGFQSTKSEQEDLLEKNQKHKGKIRVCSLFDDIGKYENCVKALAHKAFVPSAQTRRAGRRRPGRFPSRFDLHVPPLPVSDGFCRQKQTLNVHCR